MIPALRPEDAVPPGFVRIVDGGEMLCDAPIPEVEQMLRRGDIQLEDDVFQLTEAGRAFLIRRFRN